MTVTRDPTLPFEIRAAAYHFLSDLYLNPPGALTLSSMRAPVFCDSWPLGRGTPDVERGLATLKQALAHAAEDAVRAEFWQLFGTTGPAAAPPWESVYLDRDHVVFGAKTLQVRALFARYGLVCPDTDRTPDDHIGLQLEFLARLAAEAVERLNAGDAPGAAAMTAGMRESLESHLLRWADPFVRRLEAASATGFYAGLGRLTLGVLTAESEDGMMA